MVLNGRYLGYSLGVQGFRGWDAAFRGLPGPQRTYLFRAPCYDFLI